MIYHLHVVKTGGTTLFVHLKKHVPCFLRLDDVEQPDIPLPCIVSGHEVRYGMHKAYKDPDPKYMMVLRDPAEWLVSMYNMDKSRADREISFEEWYDKTGPNTVTPHPAKRDRLWEYVRRMLKVETMAEANDILQKMWFVSTTQFIDHDFGMFCDYIGIPNTWENHRVSGKNKDWPPGTGRDLRKFYTLTQAMRERIYRENEESVRIYAIARQCRAKMLLRGLE